MGLDMYLYKKNYIRTDEFYKEEVRNEVIVKTGGEIDTTIKPNRIKYIVEEVGYWRKANQIHAWFVKNVQGGTDDCAPYEVNREQLEELRQLITEALADKDASLLPPQAGFFFGNATVDEYYWQDLRETETALGKILEEFPAGWYFEYHSSW
jgi:hypothetical protein